MKTATKPTAPEPVKNAAPAKAAPVKAAAVKSEPDADEPVATSQMMAVPVASPVSQGAQGVLGGNFGGLASPVVWLVAAAARREVRPAAPHEAVASGQSTSLALTAASAVVANRPPVIGTVTVGQPNTTTGVVTGKVAATDADNDILTFTAPTTSAKSGAVAINSATGAFTYTPTAAARHAAAATGASSSIKTDTFTVTVSDTAGGAAAKTVTVAVAPKNTAPVITTATVGTPKTSTGVVTGTVVATDADTDQLTYSAKTSTKGTVAINATTGAFTYTPTTTARIAAAATGALATAKKDVVTVTVTDAHGGTATRSLTVPIAPKIATSVTVVGSVSLPASGQSTPPVFSPDGSRALLTSYTQTGLTYTTQVAVINTATGAQTGTTITLGGRAPYGSPLFSADGSRVLITTVEGAATTAFTTRVAVINTVTGNQTGTTLTLPGQGGLAAFSSDGTRALFITTAYDPITEINNPVTKVNSTGVAIINMATGAQITLNRTGSASATFSADDSRVLIADTAGFTLINTTTCAQVGSTFKLPGSASGTWSADGSRLLIATTIHDSATGTDNARFAMINTTTGTQVGTTFKLAGALTAQASSADGSRALITATSGNVTTGFTSRVAVLNTTTGAQVGTTVTLAGKAQNALTTDATHILITTASGKGTTQLSVVDTTTGTKSGTTVALTGDLQNAVTDATHTLITTTSGNVTTGFTSRVAVLNTATGAQVGTTVTLAGKVQIALTTDTTHALIITASGKGTARLSVVNTTTGAQTGATVALTGDLQNAVTTDATHTLITTTFGNVTTGFTTRVAVLNTTTGTQTGTTVTLAGNLENAVTTDATHTLITTASGKGTTRLSVVNTTTGTQTGTTLTITGDLQNALTTDATHTLITTTDGKGTTRVAVLNTGTGTQSGTTLTLVGNLPNSPLIADATHALITTTAGDETVGFTTRFTAINTVSGKQIGSTLTVKGQTAFIPLGANSTRGLIGTTDGTRSTGWTTRVVELDLTVGAQIGTTLVMSGGINYETNISAPVLVSADGKHAVIITHGSRLSGDGPWATRVAVMDTTTGTPIGTTTLSGEVSGATYAQLSDDGTRAVIATMVFSSITSGFMPDTRFAVIDTTSGKQVGTDITIQGEVETGLLPMLTADGTRLLIITDVYDGATYTNSARVAVINTTTGAQIGTTVTLANRATYPPMLLSAKGSHVLVTTSAYSPYTGLITTDLVVVNTITGTQTGTTIAGGQAGQPLFSPDGTRIAIPIGSSSLYSRTIGLAVLRLV